MRILVCYYSRTGTTKKMAEIITEELKKLNATVDCLSVESVPVESLTGYDGIALGGPTYYGTLPWQIKKLLDDSVSLHGKLDGKAGLAFSSSANIAGGNETTVLSILEAMLIHGMVIQGDYTGDHYGPVSVGTVDSRCIENCRRMAQRLADLIKKIAPQ